MFLDFELGSILYGMKRTN